MELRLLLRGGRDGDRHDHEQGNEPGDESERFLHNFRLSFKKNEMGIPARNKLSGRRVDLFHIRVKTAQQFSWVSFVTFNKP